MSDSLVLCYHAVSERWSAPLSVTPDNLERQLGLLVARGYRGVTFGELSSGRTQGKVMCVTFDDAFRSVIELGLPILAELDVPGTVFAPTAFVGRPEPMVWPGIDQWLGGPHESELACMSWDELRQLHAAGWQVGSHTRTHPHLTQVGQEQLRDELEGSRADCEQGMGEPCGDARLSLWRLERARGLRGGVRRLLGGVHAAGSPAQGRAAVVAARGRLSLG